MTLAVIVRFRWFTVSASAGPNQLRDINTAGSALRDHVRLLSSIVAALFGKLDRRSPEIVPQAVCGDFSGFVSTVCAGFSDGGL